MVNTSKPHDLAVDQICDWHRVNNPNDAAIAYLDKDDSKVIITWEHLWRAITKGTEIINHEIPDLGKGNSGDKPMVIAILANIGSTSLPKPRTLLHLVATEWSFDYERLDTSIQGETMAVSPPICHGMGLISSFYMAGSRVCLALNSPHGSFGSVTSDSFLKIVMKTEAKYMVTIPAFLEVWSENPTAVEYLKTMKGIIWGGGPLGNGEIGKRLFEQGVPLFLMYGTTETGLIHRPLSKPIKEGYEWFSFGSHITNYLAPMGAPNTFQNIVLENDVHHLNVHSTEINGVRAWNTNDIIERHPTNHDIYRFVGREEDLIVSSNGQKTNPGPLESIIRKDSHVQDVLYFGGGRPTLGVLIQPASFEKVKELGLSSFRDLIWPSVEAANTYAPAYSKVFKEMILVATPEKPFAYTSKETLRKGYMLGIYAQEIEELYRQFESLAGTDIPVATAKAS